MPTSPGVYAPVIYLPGFGLAPSSSSTLLEHVAGHGAIVVGVAFNSSFFNQIATADVPDVIAFVRAGLDGAVAALAPGVVVADMAPVVVAHYRGGKVTWRVLLADATLASGLTLIDPVDAPPPAGASISDPNAVTGALAFSGPAVVAGTGKGPTGFQPCAPAGEGHDRFAGALAGDVHVVDAAAGHNDLLNSPGFVCARGDDPGAFRDAVAGLAVATLREVLGVTGAARAAAESADAGVTFGFPD